MEPEGSILRCPAAPGRRSLSHCRAHPPGATMPLARIDLRKGKSADYLQRVGETIYQAMRAVGVPENDRFQIFQEHEPRLIYDPGYLGVDRTDDFICIQITWNEGRTLEQEKRCTWALPMACMRQWASAARMCSSTWWR